MPLIGSPRLTPADRAAWHRRARHDAAHGSTPRMARLAAQARAAIEEFAAAHPEVPCPHWDPPVVASCHVGVSWGRDSVAVAHLAHGTGLPLLHVTHGTRADRTGNPDCPPVRDAYLATWPAPYLELPVETPRAYQWVEAHVPPAPRVTGIRADESSQRALSASVHGTATALSCRPILRWRSEDVWAYLAVHDLPVHPAYAMSLGGLLPRDRIRVSSFGGTRGMYAGRHEWEDHYYPEALDLHRRQRQGLA